MKRLLIIFAILTLFSTTAFPASYTKYVKTAGNDGSAGDADGSAWATTERVNTFLDTLGSGDDATVYFNKADVWSSDEDLGQNGGTDIDFPDVTLVFDAYGTGVNPKFNTETMRMLFIRDASIVNITINDIDLYGSSDSYIYPVYIKDTKGTVTIDGMDGDGRGDGSVRDPQLVVYLRNVEGAIELMNCNLSGWGPASNPTENGDTHIFYIYTALGRTSPLSIKIYDNTLHSVNADAIQIGGFIGSGSNWIEIYDNTLYDCGENLIDLKSCEYVKVYGNTGYRNGWADGGTSGAGNLIQVNCGSAWGNARCKYVYIYNNYLSENDNGTNSYGGVGSGCCVEELYIYNNYILNCSPAIRLAENCIYPAMIYYNLVAVTAAISTPDANELIRVDYNDSLIYGNTAYLSSNSGMIYGFLTNNSTSALTIQNNIFFVDVNSVSAYGLYHYGGTAPTVSYNDYYNSNHTNRVYYDSTAYDSTEQADWISAGHVGALFADPKLNDPSTSKYYLDSDSPCIDVGTPLGEDYDAGWNSATSLPPTTVSTLDQDLNGDTWEMGVYVYPDAPPPQPGTSGVARRLTGGGPNKVIGGGVGKIIGY